MINLTGGLRCGVRGNRIMMAARLEVKVGPICGVKEGSMLGQYLGLGMVQL